MLDRSAVVRSLLACYGVVAAELTFLPLGADAGTAVYRVAAHDGASYFLKLRRHFDAAAVAVPHLLRAQGIEAVMAPLATSSGELSIDLDGFRATLFRYIDGHDAVDEPLTDRQWGSFGAALRAIHAVILPPPVRELVRHETYAPDARDAVVHWLRVADAFAQDPLSTRLAGLLRARQAPIEDVVRRAAGLAAVLAARSPDLVLCHSDVHAANLLVDDRTGRVYIVDWDDPILAPKERDLMFIGGGVCGGWDTPREERLFYAGYGAAEVDRVAVAYYRFERIVADIAADCEEVFLTSSADNREQSLGYFDRQFSPGSVVDIAYATAAGLPGDLPG